LKSNTIKNFKKKITSDSIGLFGTLGGETGIGIFLALEVLPARTGEFRNLLGIGDGFSNMEIPWIPVRFYGSNHQYIYQIGSE
jgi:hypothetical protein